MRPADVVRAIFIGFALTTAFTTGATMELGIGLLPIIDKGHLLVLLGFYIASAALLVTIGRLLYDYVWPTAAQFGIIYNIALGIAEGSRRGWRVGWRHGLRLARRFRRRAPAMNVWGNRDLRWDERFASMSGALIVFLLFFWATISLSITLQLEVPDITKLPRSARNGLLIGLAFAIAFVVIALPVFGRAKSQFRTKMQVVLASLAFLSTAFGLGVSWVEYLRTWAPRVDLSWADSALPNSRVTIVMPATDGLLLFENGSRGAIFVPWQRISRITS